MTRERFGAADRLRALGSQDALRQESGPHGRAIGRTPGPSALRGLTAPRTDRAV